MRNNNRTAVLDLTLAIARHLSNRRRWQIVLLTVIMIFASLTEVMSIGILVPFLSALINPENLFELPIAQPAIRLFGIKTADELVGPMAIVFAIAAVVAASLKILTFYLQIKISYGIGIDFGYEIFRKKLYQKYLKHTQINSSELIAAVYEKVSYVIVSFLMPILTTISSLFILAAMLMLLLTLTPIVTLISLTFFILLYSIIFAINKRKLSENSNKINIEKDKVIRILQESLGGIRDILLDGTQEQFSKAYREAVTSLRNAEASVGIRGGVPRFIIEAVSMVLLTVVTFVFIKTNSDSASIIPILGAMALAAQRILPLLNQCYANTTYIYGARATVQQTVRLLNQPLTVTANSLPAPHLLFNDHIFLNNISFQYGITAPVVLNQISLTVLKGARLGLIGTTGSGKSTLLDILMGLLSPTHGTFEVDGQVITDANVSAWQRRVAHVPQSVFLADASILENIALGVPLNQIDVKRANAAVEMAQLADTINNLPLGYQTTVGERGSRLSGGQRQRIGIARALYKGVDVLILDEATSALDLETERAVMEGVNRLPADLTVIIVAHRLSTLSGCSEIMEIKEGKLQRVDLG